MSAAEFYANGKLLSQKGRWIGLLAATRQATAKRHRRQQAPMHLHFLGVSTGLVCFAASVAVVCHQMLVGA